MYREGMKLVNIHTECIVTLERYDFFDSPFAHSNGGVGDRILPMFIKWEDSDGHWWREEELDIYFIPLSNTGNINDSM